MTLPDPEAVLKRGQEALELLNSPTFLAAVDSLSVHHMQAVAVSPPGEVGREAREHHHLLHYALSEICAQLQGWVSAAEEIAKHADETDEDEL